MWKAYVTFPLKGKTNIVLSNHFIRNNILTYTDKCEQSKLELTWSDSFDILQSGIPDETNANI